MTEQEFILGGQPPGDLDRPLRQVMRPVVWCRPDDRIRDVARRIGDSGHSCALVRGEAGPGEAGPGEAALGEAGLGEAGLGIVTDHDFRERVATGEVAPDAPVAELATAPVLTIDEGATPTAALLHMIEHGVHHLVVTESAGPPIGVVRVVDLARAELRDPLLIRSAVDSAATLTALAQASAALPATIAALRGSGAAVPHIGAVHAAIIDAIVRRALELCANPVLAVVEHSWIVLGSLARREPLPQSDLDTALLWADPPPESPDPAEAVRSAAGDVLDELRACRLTPCPNGANANNPLFSRSQSGWTEAARTWMRDPSREGALLLSAMVADSRPITNVALGLHITDSIRQHTRTSQFLRALLDEALGWRPPTGFVRDFVVLHSGEHRGELDLKRGGLAPVVALGRWIAIVTGDARGTTTQRLHRGADAGLLTSDERHTLVGGFEGVYTLVFDREVEAIRSGGTPTTYINPRDLDFLTRRHLRETFRAISQVQNRIDQEWIRRLG